MKPICRQVRTRLERSSDGKLPAGLDGHVADCPACARWAARLRAARQALRDHHAAVEPDAGFAARVAVQLRRDPAADLGRAAARLLPATLALLALLAWIAIRTGPVTTEAWPESEAEDLLSWVVAGMNGGAP